MEVTRPTAGQSLHFGPSTAPAAPPSAFNSSSPHGPAPSSSPSGGRPPPPHPLRHKSSAELDLDSIKDPRVRDAVDPNSRMSFQEIAKWSEEELDSFVDAFAPEFIPALHRKSASYEAGHTGKPLSWEGLTYANKKGDELLKHVSGYLNPGEMVGILAGPDGGATPLLNILAGREKATAWTGDVRWDGSAPSEDFNRFIGYVSKEDTHIALLSVFETLYFSARLRLPAEVPDNLVIISTLHHHRDRRRGRETASMEKA